MWRPTAQPTLGWLQESPGDKIKATKAGQRQAAEAVKARGKSSNEGGVYGVGVGEGSALSPCEGIQQLGQGSECRGSGPAPPIPAVPLPRQGWMRGGRRDRDTSGCAGVGLQDQGGLRGRSWKSCPRGTVKPVPGSVPS